MNPVINPAANPAHLGDVQANYAEALEYRERMAAGKGPTLKYLLDRGRAVLEGREAKARADEDRRLRDLRAAWLDLLADARAVLGEVLGDQPPAPPDGFKPGGDWTFELRPFGAGVIAAAFALRPVYHAARQAEWSQVAAGSRDGETYKVATAYRAEYDSDLPKGPVASAWHCTGDLAEAVALCERATESYRAAEREAYGDPDPKSPPDPPRDETGRVLTPEEQAAADAAKKPAQGKPKRG